MDPTLKETFATTASADAADDYEAGSRLRHSCTQLIVYMFPIQFIICIVGNILNLLVLTREKVSTSRQVYIISLSITDLLYFILLAFSIERCMAITRPFSRVGGGLASKARRIVYLIVGLTLLHAWVECYRYYRTIVLVDRGVPATDAYELNHAPEWLVSWANEYQLVHLIILPIVVFVTLFVTTTLIIIALAKQRCCHRQTLDPKQFREANVSRQYTLMLLAAGVTYIIFCSWNFLMNVGDFLSRYAGVKNPLGNPDEIQNLLSCQAVATNWNYALNFILYSLVSSEFRHHLKTLSCRASRRWSDRRDIGEDGLSPTDSPGKNAQPIMIDSTYFTTNTAIVPLTMITAPSTGATVSIPNNGRHYARSFDDGDDRILFRSIRNSAKNISTAATVSRSKSPTISLQNVN